MKILLFIFFIPTLILAKEACFIKLHSNVYYTERKDLTEKEIISDTNCPEKFSNQISAALLEYENIVSIEYFKNIHQDIFASFDVTISPPSIALNSLAKIIKSKLELPTNWEIQYVKLLSSKKILFLKNDDLINIRCSNCNTLGNKNIEFTVNRPLTKSSTSEWMSATINCKTNALISKYFLPANNQPLTLNKFELKEIQSTTPEKLFITTDDLKFYKLNKPISQNAPLLYSDLTPIMLVNSGSPAQIVFDTTPVKLTGMAIPIQSGKFGELIQLRPSKGNKIIMGKVIDFNKVIVTL